MIRVKLMRAKISLLFHSPSVKIFDYHCCEVPKMLSPLEESPTFEITYTRTGHFFYRLNNKEHTVDTTVLLLKNAESEHRVHHGPTVNDTCTVFQFSRELMEEMEHEFRRHTKIANFPFRVSILPASPALDFFHREIYSSLASKNSCSLKIDSLALSFLEEMFRLLHESSTAQFSSGEREELRKKYSDVMERAKAYMIQNFSQDLSLKHVARNAYLSEFHFSRIFRAITSYSPYQYLIDLRFQYAAMLLRDTNVPVTDICYSSGFGNLPHFIAAFKQRYRRTPRQYRKLNLPLNETGKSFVASL